QAEDGIRYYKVTGVQTCALPISLALPATFTYSGLPGTAGARLSLYGPGPSIGDPWYSGKLDKSGTADFDGGFNTNKAPDSGLVRSEERRVGKECRSRCSACP